MVKERLKYNGFCPRQHIYVYIFISLKNPVFFFVIIQKYQPKLSRFAFKDQLDWKENKTSASLINCKENKHKLIIINGSKYTLPHESMVDRELNASNVEFENSKILYSEKQSIVQIDDISNYFEEINYLLPHVKENLKNLQIKSSCYMQKNKSIE